MSNIMVDSKGQVKLIDFGFSKFHFSRNQRSSDFSGTPKLMAPEIFERVSFDGKSDKLLRRMSGHLGLWFFVYLRERFRLK